MLLLFSLLPGLFLWPVLAERRLGANLLSLNTRIYPAPKTIIPSKKTLHQQFKTRLYQNLKAALLEWKALRLQFKIQSYSDRKVVTLD